MTRRPAVTHRSAGFTLIEVMISITLLALVAGICYAAFYLGIRAVAKGEMAVVTSQRLRAATDVLIHQVKSTVAAPAMVDGEAAPFFYGTATSMSFVTESGQLGGGGRAWVRYSFVADPPQLVMEESPNTDADTLGGKTPEAEEPQRATVLDGFRAMHFDYLDGMECTDEPGWLSTWDSRELDCLPTAVRIVVEGLFGLDEDVWGQEIPLMAFVTTYNEDTDFPEPQECDDLTTTGGGSGTGTGTEKSGAADKDDDADDADVEGDE
jgi:prepilin-type N-terminal cleavage/methylation domain-containing protein